MILINYEESTQSSLGRLILFDPLESKVTSAREIAVCPKSKRNALKSNFGVQFCTFKEHSFYIVSIFEGTSERTESSYKHCFSNFILAAQRKGKLILSGFRVNHHPPEPVSSKHDAIIFRDPHNLPKIVGWQNQQGIQTLYKEFKIWKKPKDDKMVKRL